MGMIKKPNLPSSRCKHILAGGLSCDCINELNRMGIILLQPEPEQDLPIPLRTHADLILHTFGNEKFIISEKQPTLSAELSRLGMTKTAEVQLQSVYPNDVPLNVAACGNTIFLNRRTADKKIIDFYEKNRYNIVDIRQGYSKCSIVVVSDTAIITEDNGIESAARANGLDVLKITPGYVALSGYDRGFIGGACGKSAPDALIFNGKISEHPNYAYIRSFCLNYGVYTYALGDNPLYDNGGLLPLDEI